MCGISEIRNEYSSGFAKKDMDSDEFGEENSDIPKHINIRKKEVLVILKMIISPGPH